MKFGGQPTPWSDEQIDGLRCRTVAQMLIEEIGADGPESAEDAAKRAVAVIQRQRARIATLEAEKAERDAQEPEAWVLRKNNAGEYQRVRREETDMKASPVATVTQINPAADRVEKSQGTIMDRIAELSSEIRATSAQFATAFARLATKLDEIGMDAGQQAHISAEEAAKFRQFKELFRSL